MTGLSISRLSPSSTSWIKCEQGKRRTGASHFTDMYAPTTTTDFSGVHIIMCDVGRSYGGWLLPVVGRSCYLLVRCRPCCMLVIDFFQRRMSSTEGGSKGDRGLFLMPWPVAPGSGTPARSQANARCTCSNHNRRTVR